MSRLSIPVDTSDHAQGPLHAPVTLVEYGDYQCPYCGEAYPVLKEVQRIMGERLRLVFRNFPLSEMHPHAVQAAEFAEAAAAEGKFWEAHDILYERQDALTRDDLIDYANEIGLHASVVEQAFAGRFDGKLETDFNGGVRSGVNGTPTLFINGIRHDGSRDVESLVAALTQAAER